MTQPLLGIDKCNERTTSRLSVVSNPPRLVIALLAGALDSLLLLFTFVLANEIIKTTTIRADDWRMLVAFTGMFLAASFYAKNYSVSALISGYASVVRLLNAWLAALALVLLLFFTIKDSATLSRGLFFTTATIGPIVLSIGRVGFVRFIRNVLHISLLRQLLIIDDQPVAEPEGWTVIPAADYELRPDAHNPLILHNFSGMVAPFDRVVVSCRAERRRAWALYLQAVACNGELIMPELDGIITRKPTSIAPWPTLQASIGPLDLPGRISKRIFDLAITAPLIVALSPVLLILAIAVRIDSPGPILFRQQRMGRHNRLFNVYKFRSMYHEKTDYSGSLSSSRSDDRVTRVGRVIRATSLDELPQLFNVIQGDMSLVGPRPHALGSRAGDSLFWEIDLRYWLRHAIKPGITGLAQVRGYRGATVLREDLSNRLGADLEYLDGWSMIRDLQILLRTVKVVIHKNAF
ncbi:sugar transferase [Sphingomonas sp. 35-24ZXX]|uniref:sugar transferase n=1 Tax=Sphingomonas sp. 35-24ZXX TaxID=1545915 RepID=UPI0009DDA997|nr:sugar transferase [Sphingomonas sp. 35-24ZXX]